MQDVWRVLAICSTACRVQRHKFSGFGTCSFFVNGRVSEGANEESIRLVLNDASRVWLRTADERYAREYNGPRMRFKEGPLDVQAVLEKNKSGSSDNFII